MDRDAYRDALSWWASGVTVVALRDEDQVHAMTVSSLTSVSDAPPTVLVSLMGSARLVPYVSEGTRLGISVLGAQQRRVASVYADSFPVGPSPFGPSEPPLVDGALVGLDCVVETVTEVAGSRVVACRVLGVRRGDADEPLVYFRRGYGRLAPPD